jgi:poly(3-hydroxybutyrate) depolymerase
MERNILTAVLAVLLVLCAPAMADWATATVHVGDQPQAVAVNPKKGHFPYFEPPSRTEKTQTSLHP